jgi:hypothetical protein
MEVFVMSEELNVASGQAVGTAPGSAPVPDQPVTPAGEGNEPTGQEEAKKGFITREEAEALRLEIINEARSYSDKGRVRVENAVKEVTNSVAALRNLGQAITPEQEKSLRDAAVQKAMIEPEPAPAGQAPQAEPQGQVDPNILEIQKDKGIELFDGDPELALIDRTKSQLKFYKSVEAACEAKKARLASAPKEPIQPISPAARVPAGGGPSSPERTGRDYLQEAHKQTNHT